MSAAENENPQQEGAGLSEFEKQRLAHIRRNMEYLARLGLADAAKELQDDAPKAEKKKRVKKVGDRRRTLSFLPNLLPPGGRPLQPHLMHRALSQRRFPRFGATPAAAT